MAKRYQHPPIFRALLHERVGTTMGLAVYRYGPDSGPMRLARAIAARENPLPPRQPTLGEALHGYNAWGITPMSEHDDRL